MPHQRSPEAQAKRQLKNEQRRTAKTYILRHGFKDSYRGETVNLTTNTQILHHLSRIYPEVYVDTAKYEKGEIILDSRGKGTFQH